MVRETRVLNGRGDVVAYIRRDQLLLACNPSRWFAGAVSNYDARWTFIIKDEYPILCSFEQTTLIVRFMWPTPGPSGADRTQVGPMLAHELCYLSMVWICVSREMLLNKARNDYMWVSSSAVQASALSSESYYMYIFLDTCIHINACYCEYCHNIGFKTGWDLSSSTIF